MSYLLVFFGAGLGGVLRYLVAVLVQKLSSGMVFPLATALVNIFGCLLIGVFAQFLETKAFFGSEWRLFLMVGVLGGFTTFSTFGYETFQLLREGQYLIAISNSLGQLIVGTLCVILGYSLGKLL